MKGRDELVHEVVQACIRKPDELHGYTKEDLMDLLAVSHREHDVTGRPPLLPQLSVMFARNVKDLKEYLFAGMLDNNESLWIAEEKLDGMRVKLHLGKNSNRVDSRHRSDVTYEYVEKTNCLPHLRDMRHFMSGTVLDGELIMPQAVVYGKTCTDSLLTATTATVNSKPGRAIELQERFGYCLYYPFDILFFRNRDVRHEPYSIRYKLLCSVRNQLACRTKYLRRPLRSAEGNFRSFFDGLVAAGGEGLMLKRLDWPYECGKQSKGMYKWKKQRTIAAFITGFIPGKGEFSGLIGALCVSTIDEAGHKHEVAAIQPGDLHYRSLISEADGSLCDDMYGKVVEVVYQCKTKNNRLRHAVLKRFRPDKSMYDCKGE